MNNNKLSDYFVKKIMRCFCADITATQATQLLEINRNTINRYYDLFRVKIYYYYSKQVADKFCGEIELDESYFGAKRVRGKRGRGAAGKTPVFGLLKRDGEVYVTVVSRCSKSDLMPIIQGKVLTGSTVYTDGWKAYDGLVLNGYDHYRVFHHENEFSRGKNHINGIEAFWSYAKRRLAKFNGIASHKFILHLNECQFRYNNRNNKNLLQTLNLIYRSC
jgi:transposase